MKLGRLPLVRLIVLAIVCAAGPPAAASDARPVFEVQGDALAARLDGREVRVSLQSPALLIDDQELAGRGPQATKGAIAAGQPLEVSYPPLALGDGSSLEMSLHLRWSQAESVLRKWARIRLVNSSRPRVLKQVVLERFDWQGRKVWTHGGLAPGAAGQIILDGPQSHPVFSPGIFVGVEFPVAATRCEEGRVVLAHRPGIALESGAWRQTRSAVYGMAPVGQEVRAFQRYIAAHRPVPKGIHVNYNSWWTSPVPYAESDILGLMKDFGERLTRPHGVGFDTFCIDLGWSNPKSIWEIDAQRFPAGFARLGDAARGMRANLGLWISPSSYYPPALEGEWAKAQGFETLAVGRAGEPAPPLRLLCLGGKRYAERFRLRLAELVGRQGVCHLKLDGCSLECPEADHGHQPGAFSSEAIAEGLLAAVEAARRANPNVWIETTCFGYNPSPWWLFHVNSVIGTFGDDAPVGRVPAPVYRESYTTARDYFNLQGAALLPIPIAAQEVLGIVHQSSDPFTNDAVMTVMRGHGFLPLYVNPKFMSGARWKALADVVRWARANSETLDQTVPLLPASWQAGSIPRFSDKGVMPREPYGYAHVAGDAGLVALRNPWIAPQAYRLKLDGALGFSPAAANMSAVSLYPEARAYGEGFKWGDTIEVPLAPYETVVLSIRANQRGDGLPQAGSAARPRVQVTACDHKLQRVEFRDDVAPLGPDWTCPLGDSRSAVRLSLEARVVVTAPQAELLVLAEGDQPPATPAGRWKLNGRDVEADTSCSAGGWSATLLPRHEHWTFLRAPLAAGENAVSLEQFFGSGCTKVSAWVWASRPGAEPADSRALPQPEIVSLGATALLAPASVTELPRPPAAIQRPVERIDGVFLDALRPVSVTQGYGTLQKNRSVWEKPMVLGGRTFLRGLGTHAPSKIVYSLEGKYRRFQAWAGADANTGPTITFEVRVDGVRRWQTGLMTRDSAPARVDIDVSGAKTLELVVGEAGNLAADHADWADARLLR